MSAVSKKGAVIIHKKLKSGHKRMPKVELINNLKGAYYRVDLRIK